LLIKWIKAQVPLEKKHQFSLAQEKWADLKNLAGFLGQVGGWNMKNELEACVLGFWKDQESYENFMKNEHDAIFEKSNQSKTYDDISINFFYSTVNIGEIAPTTVLDFAQILRVAECDVREGKQDHFEMIQETVWNPGMSNCEGYLAGVFSKGQNIHTKYLVSSFWESADLHQKYVRTNLPLLREISKVEKDLVQLVGSTISIEDSWCVTPEY
jgi:heme-degrading monooxygenase HmoA